MMVVRNSTSSAAGQPQLVLEKPVQRKAGVKRAISGNAPAQSKTAHRRAAGTPIAPEGPLASPKSESAPVAKVKAKPVRDSFTMPRADYDLIAVLKDRALGFRRPTKKSELLRAGLRALAELDTAQLQEALDSLPLLKSGRPSKASVSSEKPLGVA